MELFGGIIGNKRAKEALSKMFANDSLPHAMLFVGPKHVGKTTFANELIGKVLGGKPETSADYIELNVEKDEKTGKRKSNISVKQAREAVSRLSKTSFGGGYKVVFIEEAHRLSQGAANALLKTLEEPRGKALFILRAPSVESVIPTIASRCQIMRFSIVSRKEIEDALVFAGITRQDACEASCRSMGRPGAALKFIKDGEYRAWVETSAARVEEFFTANIAQRLAMATQMIPKGDVDAQSELKKIVNEMQVACRDALLERLGSKDFVSRKGGLAKLSARELFAKLERLSRVSCAMSHNINPHLAIEHIAL
jgi:DNA polymerase-3 subunit delta'